MDKQTINKSLAKGLSKRFDRAHRFRVSRIKDSFGFHVYVLENSAKQEKIHIKRFMFDRFRYACKKLENLHNCGNDLSEYEHKIDYRSRDHFVISTKLSEKDQFLIRELDERGNTTRYFSFKIDAIEALNQPETFSS